MKHYTKQAKTNPQLVAQLKSRGLHFANEKRAERQLGSISYYRMSAYMLPFKERDGAAVGANFVDGATWEDVHELYVFDRKLRLLLFDVIERLEVAVRAQLVNQLALKYGPHWHDKKELFQPPRKRRLPDGSEVEYDVYTDVQQYVIDQLHNDKAETFIKHYRDHYDTPATPPCWMCVEIMYFGHLSRICSNLDKRQDKAAIAKYFALPPSTFCSWLHTVNYIRNICAHHARLWNRDMAVTPEKLVCSKELPWISNATTVQRGKLYYTLCLLQYMLQSANPGSTFKKKLAELLGKHSRVVSLKAMGFPEGWQEENLWKC